MLGRWIDNSDPASYIVFSKNDDGQKFKELGWFQDTIKGDWSRTEDMLTLSFVAPGSHQIDSIAVESTADGEAVTTFFDNETAVSSTVDGEIKAAPTDFEFNYDFNEGLSLRGDAASRSFTKVVKQSATVSWLSILRGLIGMAFLIGLTLFILDQP